jgi:hypothetical protein
MKILKMMKRENEQRQYERVKAAWEGQGADKERGKGKRKVSHRSRSHA